MIRVHMQKHHDRVRNLRRFYMEDIKRAEHDPTFQTITFDGSDTRTCQCPQRWRAMQHNDTPENCYVNQKIQTVLMHGRALNMYVAMPFMECGATLTVSTLLDSLEYMDPRVEEIRFQFDGNELSDKISVMGSITDFPLLCSLIQVEVKISINMF